MRTAAPYWRWCPLRGMPSAGRRRKGMPHRAQTAPGRDRSAVWLRLDEVKAVIAALTEGAVRLVEEEVGE